MAEKKPAKKKPARKPDNIWVERLRWLRRRAADVCAFFLVAMFLCFIVQIGARYLFNYPLGWTDEASVLFWVWGTLWGAAFVLREKDEVRFDIFYSSMSEQVRAKFAVVTGIVTVALFAISLPAVYQYVTFLKVERSAYLGIRLDYLYSVYLIFAVAAIVRYSFLTYNGLRGRAPEIQIGAGSAL